MQTVKYFTDFFGGAKYFGGKQIDEGWPPVFDENGYWEFVKFGIWRVNACTKTLPK